MPGINLNSGIAIFLAVLFAALASMTQAKTLTLPHEVTDPLLLEHGQGTPDPAMLRVYVAGAGTPIAGRYLVDGTTLSFVPAFGFDVGQTYVARFVVDGTPQELKFSLGTPAAPPSAKVTAIYPSGDLLPENTLRFYVHFSVPMQPQVAFDYIRLVDASGTEDEAAFMRFKQELWNADRTRLTVLIDPGRIKRDVATNVELGPALLAGKRYSLEVRGGWRSADSTSVLPGFAKTFDVSAALRTRPDTTLWSANTPCAGTRDPLQITLDRPFDRHLLPQALRIEAGSNLPVDGRFVVDETEQSLSFTPRAPWPAENLRLLVDATLEDVAGNNFRDLLDHVVDPLNTGTSTTQFPIRTEVCR